MGEPRVLPLCRETQSLGQQMLERWEQMGYIHDVICFNQAHGLFGTRLRCVVAPYSSCSLQKHLMIEFHVELINCHYDLYYQTPSTSIVFPSFRSLNPVIFYHDFLLHPYLKANAFKCRRAFYFTFTNLDIFMWEFTNRYVSHIGIHKKTTCLTLYLTGGQQLRQRATSNHRGGLYKLVHPRVCSEVGIFIIFTYMYV